MNDYDFLAKCNYEKCEKKDDCARYIEIVKDNEPLVTFQNICKENNNYKWFFKRVKGEVNTNETK